MCDPCMTAHSCMLATAVLVPPTIARRPINGNPIGTLPRFGQRRIAAEIWPIWSQNLVQFWPQLWPESHQILAELR